MFGYIVRRLVQMLIAVFVVTIVIFLLLRVAPGDPAEMMLPEGASRTEIEAVRTSLGLDRSLPVQYGYFMKDLLHLELGTSFLYRRPVAELIGLFFPKTVILACVSLAVSLALGIPLGIIAAVKEGRLADFVAMSVAVVGQAVPAFWIGLMLILVFSLKLHLLPTSGMGNWRHLVLPVVTLSANMMALVSRLARSGMLEVLGEDYIRTARAKGLSEYLVILHHGLRNLMNPIVTVIGLSVGMLLAGSVVTESIFNWPGMGRMIVTAISARDYPVLQGATLVVSFVVILANFSVDIGYALLDPRTRL